jgi:hypothetical protein
MIKPRVKIKRFKLISIILIVMFSFIISSCKNIKFENDSNVINETFVIPLTAECEIENDIYKEIGNQIISSHIDCLKYKLNKFQKNVRSSQPRKIKKIDLQRFLIKFFNFDSKTLTVYLDQFFKVTNFLNPNEKNYISSESLDKILTFLKKLNLNLVSINTSKDRFLSNKNLVNYKSFRSKTSLALTNISKDLTSLLKKQYYFDTFELLDQLELLRKVIHDQKDVEKLKSFMYVKSLFLGGSKYRLTGMQLREFLSKLPKLGVFVLDSLYLESTMFKEQENYYWTLLDSWKLLKNQLAYGHRNQRFKVMTVFDLMKSISKLYPEKRIRKLNQSVINLKKKFFPDGTLSFNLLEINQLMDKGSDIIKMLALNEKFFNLNKDIILSKNKIEEEDIIMPSYNDVLQKRISKIEYSHYFENFVGFATKYHYYGTLGDESPLFAQEFKRNIDEIQVMSAIHFYLKNIFSFYTGTNSFSNVPIKTSLKVTTEILRDSMIDLEYVLKSFNAWPLMRPDIDFSDETNCQPDDLKCNTLHLTAKNSKNMMDLFQFQSNGDDLMSIEEGIEYFIGAITAYRATQDTMPLLRQKCLIKKNKEKINIKRLYGLDCVRDNIFQLFLEKAKYKNVFPRLYEFIKNVSKENIESFVENIEEFSRDTLDPGSPYTERDIFLFIGAVVNIESTMIRYDHNDNNLLDTFELEEAFNVFEFTIMTKAEISWRGLARSAFFYLFNFQELPDTSELLWYHSFGDKDIIGDRLAIAKILSYSVKN